MASLEELKQQRRIIKGQLTRFVTFITKLPQEKSEVNISQIEARLKTVEPLLTNFNDIQTQIENFPQREVVVGAKESEEKERDTFENIYFENVALANHFVSKHVEARASSVATSQQSIELSDSTNSSSKLRLPTINVPIFDGSYSNWHQFRDTFRTLVHADASLSSIEKFYYLRMYLSKEAARIIDALEVSTDNYELAWELLNTRFENKRLTVHNHVHALFSLPVIHKESFQSLRDLLDKVLKHLRALENLNLQTDAWDTLIIYLITSKLDPTTKREWETSISSKTKELPTFESFKEFLTRRCQILETLSPHSTQTRTAPIVKSKATNLLATATSSQPCAFCKNDSHVTNVCPELKKLSVESRIEAVKEKNLCLNCLRQGHFIAQCRSKTRCKLCGRKHNSLIHINSSNNAKGNNTQTAQNTGTITPTQKPHLSAITELSEKQPTEHSPASCSYLTNSRDVENVLLSTASALVQNSNNEYKLCRILLDNGSQANLITRACQQRLGLATKAIKSTINGVNQSISHVSQQTTINLKSRVNSFNRKISCIIIPKICEDMPAYSFNKTIVNIPPNIRMSDENYNINGPIDILLGAPIFWEMLCTGQITFGKGKPILHKTTLGWILSGPLFFKQADKIHCGLIQEFDKKLEQFWEMNDTFEPKMLSNEEQYCEDFFAKTTIRDSNGRFRVCIPFKENKNSLGDTRDIAINRLGHLEKRLNRDSNLKQLYTQFMDEYLRLGHMVEINETNQIYKDSVTSYLPHHPVIKHDSSTTKLRVVFDASVKPSTGVSLNDIQHIGPVVQNDLFTILLRFRKHKYAMTADIEKMYRQILVSETDCALQRVFWRDSEMEKIKCFELKTITYGTASAPYLATRCLIQLALDFRLKYPLASNVIENDFYVDDLLTGTDCKEELHRLKEDINHILNSAGFNLRKWLSNEAKLFSSDITLDSTYNLDRTADTKTLGVGWNAESDLIMYKLKSLPNESTVTKRSILSTSAQLFDPLGLLNPITIIPKLIIQTLWQYKLSWDESVPQDIHTSWLKFKDNLSEIDNLKIPRFMYMSNATDIQLHGFADASERAYGACIYIRSSNGFNNEVKVALVCSKSRVAPIRKISLPRLELSAAVLLANLMKKAIEALDIKFDSCFYWSDSTITLSWINSQSSRWQTFVANRVATIQRLSDKEQWCHVRSQENPADLISRGVTPTELLDSDIWWHGPSWLNTNEAYEYYPIEKSLINIEDAPEQKVAKHSLVINFDDLDLFKRFSSFRKLLRVTAWMLRFVDKCRSTSKAIEDTLSIDELNIAATKLIKVAQEQCFKEEIHDLTKGKQTSSKKLLALNPFIDDEGILRVGGRLKNSNFEYNKKHPIILSPQHALTKLIIRNEHLKNLHCGPQTLLGIIRERYWPISGKNLVKQVLKDCTVCVRVNPQAITHLMGELPASRLTPSPVFYNCGVDYAGPILLKDKRTRGNRSIKAYICLFVCMVTKCVHIELVGDLSTAAFIACLRRFIARRGKPVCFYSDNATNFVGANSELKELYSFLNSENSKKVIANFLADDNISWKFIPPRSPHFGGIWEASIKSMKTHMKRVLGNASLVFEDLNTVLTQIEAILNSRPLCPLSSDPVDTTPLTPGHFLIGRPLIALPDFCLLNIKEGRLSQFQRLQQLIQHIWARWSKEYVSQLQRRNKWKKQESALLKEGELVVIKEDNLPPLKWQLGRVVRVIHGKDNIARVAEVKTASGLLKRAVTRLCVLPSDV